MLCICCYTIEIKFITNKTGFQFHVVLYCLITGILSKMKSNCLSFKKIKIKKLCLTSRFETVNVSSVMLLLRHKTTFSHRQILIKWWLCHAVAHKISEGNAGS